MADAIDPNSATWRAVSAWAAARLAMACSRLEAPALDVTRTEQLRGEIATLRAVLELAEPKRLFPAEKPVPYT